MARANAVKHYYNFVRGKITEANALTFPENSAKEICNVDLIINGTIKRRLGLDYEAGFKLSDFTIPYNDVSLGYTSVFVWEGVNADANKNFLVIKIGAVIYFYDLSFNPISFGFVNTLDLSPYFIDGKDAIEEPIDVASGKGVLFIAGESLEPIYVKFDEPNIFTAFAVQMKLRDFDGVEDGLGIQERPDALTPEHHYNLKNANWDQMIKIHGKKGLYDPIEETKAEIGKYPSKADIWYLAKLPDNDQDGEEVYKPDTLDNYAFGNTPAPIGHYILDLFIKDRSAVSGVPGLAAEVDKDRPRTVAFFAGRVWYAHRNEIYFSPILSQTSLDKAGNFYQEQDPTAEEFNELLDTDGGIAAVPEMGTCYRLIPIGSGILAFANNGIWMVSAGDGGGGFRPTGFSIDKMSDVGVLSGDTVVKVETTVFYWSDGGIYVLTPDQISGKLSANNLSLNSIQTDYLSIKNIAKRYAKAFYDKQFKKIFWLYNDDPNYTGLEFKNRYNHILIYDVPLNAFYDYKISDLEAGSPFVSGMFLQAPLKFSEEKLIVCVDDKIVCVGPDQVVINKIYLAESETAIKLVTLVPIGGAFKLTFSQFTSKTFKDWFTADSVGVNYDSYLETGYEHLGDPIRDKQASYIFCFLNRTEQSFVDKGGEIQFDFPSSCVLSAKWEWTNSSFANKWVMIGQIYRLNHPYIPGNPGDPFDYGYDVVVTKTKVRGVGKALHLRYESEEGKDFQLNGWSIEYTSTTVP